MPVQTILAELRKNSLANNYETDMEGHLTKLFFASPHFFAMFKHYPEVLILDCTYKKNCFKFPLLNMVAVNGLGQTFYVAFAFLRYESENDFRWALGELRTHITHPLNFVSIDRDLALMNAVRGVFPSSTILLCHWHVLQQKNNDQDGIRTRDLYNAHVPCYHCTTGPVLCGTHNSNTPPEVRNSTSTGVYTCHYFLNSGSAPKPGS